LKTFIYFYPLSLINDFYLCRLQFWSAAICLEIHIKLVNNGISCLPKYIWLSAVLVSTFAEIFFLHVIANLLKKKLYLPGPIL